VNDPIHNFYILFIDEYFQVVGVTAGSLERPVYDTGFRGRLGTTCFFPDFVVPREEQLTGPVSFIG